jgi:hypothetical protein
MHKPIWSMTKTPPKPGQARTPNRFRCPNTNTDNTSKWAIQGQAKVCKWATTPRDTTR